MVMLWSVTSLNYYLITFFMKYVPGNIYVNTSVSALSELVAYASSGFAYKILGGKPSFWISFFLAGIGGILIAISPNAVGYKIASFVLVAKFGISFAFNLVYIITPSMFPTDLCTTAFGICNGFAMFSSVLSPMVAETTEPLPMMIYALSSFAAIIATIFLNTKVKYD